MRVEQRRDETLWVRFRESYLKVQVCEAPSNPRPLPARSGGKKIPKANPDRQPRNWMQGFQLRKSLPVWKVIKQDTGGWVPSQGPPSADPVGR